MLSSFPILVALIAACFFVYRIEYAMRVQALWQRRIEIDKALGVFAKAKRDVPKAYRALSDGVDPDAAGQDWIDYRYLIEIWRNSVSIVYVTMKEGDPYQVFSREYPNDFKDYATSILHSLLDVALATMQNDLTSNSIFNGLITIDRDIFNYIHLYLDHERRFEQEVPTNA
jgi:hypothetical protein